MTKQSDITLIKNAIHNPAEPRHYMTLTPRQDEYYLSVGETVVGKSKKVIAMHEVAHIILDPVHYFPQKDIAMDMFLQSDKSTFCPLKGEASYYSLKVGDKFFENVAWSYAAPISIAAGIRGLLAFDTRIITCRRKV